MPRTSWSDGWPRPVQPLQASGPACPRVFSPARLERVTPRDPAAYGQIHAPVYDQIYDARFDAVPAVAALAAAAAGGTVLELGLGTGRLAIPLARAGVSVDGIEASDAMIARLRAQPGADRVGVLRADLRDFELPRHDYQVAVCAVSTLLMLDHSAQQACLNCVARHLLPGGRLFIEAFVPDPSRFDADGRRIEHRPAPAGAHTVTSRHDPTRRRIHIVHTLTDPHGHSAGYPVTLHYATAAELDAMAAAAGLSPAGRWHDWAGSPAHAHSNDPISMYLR